VASVFESMATLPLYRGAGWICSYPNLFVAFVMRDCVRHVELAACTLNAFRAPV
jgi:hypothetical protein